MDFNFIEYNRRIERNIIGSKEYNRINGHPLYSGIFGDYNRRIDEKIIGSEAWKWNIEDNKFPLIRDTLKPLKNIKCKTCNGSGEVNTNVLFGPWHKTCPDCNGAG